jgi:hypothetical protein
LKLSERAKDVLLHREKVIILPLFIIVVTESFPVASGVAINIFYVVTKTISCIYVYK